MFSDAESDEIGTPVTIEELESTIKKMPKEKSPDPDGWTQELFLSFFDIMGKDLLLAVEESRNKGYIPGVLNATFFTLIPKVRKPTTFNDFRPIALCNFVYKVISKVIVNHIKDKLACCITKEQFGFLKDRLIYDVVGLAQESLHTVKTKKLSSVILKLDLKKAYDKVSWQFLRLILIQIGLKWDVAQWIMACVTNVSMAVLINGSPTSFFKIHRGLRQGCPLSPLMFLLIIDCLSRQIKKAVSNGSFKGIKIVVDTFISHLLFVDDVLILGNANFEEWSTFHTILRLFCKASGMVINCQKSCFIAQNIEPDLARNLSTVFNIHFQVFDDGMKYLGYFLKENNYRVADWNWLIKKIEKRIGSWSFRWLSLGGRVVLAKAVLQSILVYWLSLVKIPSTSLHRIKQLITNFIWRGSRKSNGFHLASWKKIALPKDCGGWGLQNLEWFSQALAAKSCWRGLFGGGLWSIVLRKKYLKGIDVPSWIKRNNFNFPTASIIWRNLMTALPIILRWIAWTVGSGNQISLGLDAFIGGNDLCFLSPTLISHIHNLNIFTLAQAARPNVTASPTVWFDSNQLKLTGEIAIEWDSFILTLRTNGITLTESNDQLVWSWNRSLGTVLVNSAFQSIIFTNLKDEKRWWYKAIWLVKVPSKITFLYGYV
jgi:hypothetical protein